MARKDITYPKRIKANNSELELGIGRTLFRCNTLQITEASKTTDESIDGEGEILSSAICIEGYNTVKTIYYRIYSLTPQAMKSTVESNVKYLEEKEKIKTSQKEIIETYGDYRDGGCLHLDIGRDALKHDFAISCKIFLTNTIYKKVIKSIRDNKLNELLISVQFNQIYKSYYAIGSDLTLRNHSEIDDMDPHSYTFGIVTDVNMGTSKVVLHEAKNKNESKINSIEEIAKNISSDSKYPLMTKKIFYYLIASLIAFIIAALNKSFIFAFIVLIIFGYLVIKTIYSTFNTDE